MAADVISKQLLLAFPHVVVELTGSEDRGLDGFLDDRGLMRRTWNERLLLDTANEDLIGRVAVTVPTYSAVAPNPPPNRHDRDIAEAFRPSGHP